MIPPIRSVFVCQVRDNGRRRADKGKDETLDVFSRLLTGSLIRLAQMSTPIAGRRGRTHRRTADTDTGDRGSKVPDITP